jgi:hypothetical protein
MANTLVLDVGDEGLLVPLPKSDAPPELGYSNLTPAKTTRFLGAMR